MTERAEIECSDCKREFIAGMDFYVCKMYIDAEA
jgi:hypothetical protein